MLLRTEQANKWPLIYYKAIVVVACWSAFRSSLLSWWMTRVEGCRDSQKLGGARELLHCGGETLCLPTDVICVQGMRRRGPWGGHLALVQLLHGDVPAVARGAQAVGIQHLQQQVIERHHVLALHVVQVLHAFVTVGGKTQREDCFRPPQAPGSETPRQRK